MAIERITKQSTTTVTERPQFGRPTKYSNKLATDICTHISNGKSLRQIAELENYPSIEAMRVWLIKYPDFAVQYAHARDEQADYYADEILATIENAPSSRDEIERAKVKVEALKWIASKLKPRKYGDKLDVTSDGERIEQPIYGGMSVPKKQPPIEAELVKPKQLPKPKK